MHRSGTALSDVDPALALAGDIGAFTTDPLGYALYAFAWGEGDLAGMAGPRVWQCAVMTEIRDCALRAHRATALANRR